MCVCGYMCVCVGMNTVLHDTTQYMAKGVSFAVSPFNAYSDQYSGLRWPVIENRSVSNSFSQVSISCSNSHYK
jgi:hypothetical protein